MTTDVFHRRLVNDIKRLVNDTWRLVNDIKETCK